MEHNTNTERSSILIVEDEKDLREALFTVFAAEAFEVLVAEDGEEGLAKALSEHPDLILLDLMLPKKSGQEVLDALREDEWGKNAKVIVLTALEDLETLSSTIEKGGTDYLVKSDWKLQDIVAKVKERLAE